MSVGGTYVKEEQSEKNYQLAGADTSLRLGDKNKLTAEYAESRSEELSGYISTDGGLSFTEIETADDAKGGAYGLKFVSNIIKNLGQEAHYKKIEKAFFSIKTLQEQGKEISGGKAVYDINDKTRITLRHETQELIDNGNNQSALQVGANQTRNTIAQIIRKFKKLTLAGEYRHQEAEGIISAYKSGSDPDKDHAALKADYNLNEKTILSLERQAAVKGAANNQTTAGITRKINEKLTVRAKESVGTNGAATGLGANYNITDKLEILGDYLAGNFGRFSTDSSLSLTSRVKGDNNDELYYTYTAGRDEIEGKRHVSVIGTKRKFENGVEVSMEEEKKRL